MLLFLLHTADSGTCDRPIDPTNQNQYIVWGIGSLGETAFQHHTRATGEQCYTSCAHIDLHLTISHACG